LEPPHLGFDSEQSKPYITKVSLTQLRGSEFELPQSAENGE